MQGAPDSRALTCAAFTLQKHLQKGRLFFLRVCVLRKITIGVRQKKNKSVRMSTLPGMSCPVLSEVREVEICVKVERLQYTSIYLHLSTDLLVLIELAPSSNLEVLIPYLAS